MQGHLVPVSFNWKQSICNKLLADNIWMKLLSMSVAWYIILNMWLMMWVTE